MVDGEVSVVVLAFFFCYGTLRTALWTRGQWRFRRLRAQLPRAAARVSAPAHVEPALGDLLACSYTGRVRLIESVRSIATVLIVDPDAPLGVVRDFRYRLALAEAWKAARAWLRTWDGLGEAQRRRLEELGYTPRVFDERSAALHGVVRRSVRAPALEPFAVGDVESVQRTVLALVQDLEGFERAVIAAPRPDPYRA